MRFMKITGAVCALALMGTCAVFAAEETEDCDIELMAQVFDGGNGTEDDPYLISTANQLSFVADLPGKCYRLQNDILLQSEWTPIGAYGEPFSGTFDGGGHTISNMIVTGGAGLFKSVSGTITDLNVSGSVSSVEQYAGGITGQSTGAITRCTFKGDVSSEYKSTTDCYVGGIVGKSSGTIEDCSCSGAISASGYSGGIAGKFEGDCVKNCHSAGSVSGYNSGGLIGSASGTVSDCYSSCAVDGSYRVGGLLGDANTVMRCYATGDVTGGETGGLIGISWGYINRCYATGDVMPKSSYSSSSYGGGLIGESRSNISECYAVGNVVTASDNSKTYSFEYAGGLIGKVFSSEGDIIKNCYSTGSVSGEYCGGFIGNADNYHKQVEIDNCYAAGTISESYNKGGLIGSGYAYAVTSSYYDSQLSGCNDTKYGSPRTTSGMKNQLIYDGWDFDTIWGIDETTNNGYPFLLWSRQKVTGISFDTAEAEVRIGLSITLHPTIEGEYTEGAELEWKSSNPSVADVKDGVVTGKLLGTTVITASCGGYSASCTVNVTDGTIRVTGVTLDKASAGLVVGETTQLTATVMPEGATNKEIKWTSSSNAVATVSDSGLVTALTEGTAQIRATSVSNGSCYAICDVTVAAKRVPVTGIEISNNVFGLLIQVDIGKTALISYSVKPDNATNKSVIWTSGDSNIATVENGRVTGVSEGSTTITATTADGGFSASCSVKVTKPTVAVTGIQVYPEQMTVNVKEQKKLQAAVTPTDATDKNITFKSNNNAIANVTADGTVTGVSPGTTLIQAISETSAGKFIAFCTVTVPKPVVEVTSVKLDKSSLEIVEGKTVPLKAVIKPSNATYKLLTWSTSEESVATVSQDGYVTAQGEGDAVISVTATNGVHTECSVKVLPSDTPAQLRVENATVKAGKEIPITVSIASNPGISTFNFDLTYDNTKMYPVSYTAGDVLSNVNIVTPLGSQSFEDKTSVRFLCNTKDLKNMDTDGDLITVVFKTLENVEYGDYTIGIVPSGFTNEFYDAVNLVSNDCTLSITDYTIGDVNNDDVVDLKDSMILGQYIAGFGTELTPQGKKAAVSIYPDKDDDVNTSEPSLNDFQHLIRYLSDWQVELGKN